MNREIHKKSNEASYSFEYPANFSFYGRLMKTVKFRENVQASVAPSLQ